MSDEPDDLDVVYVDYTNHRGERAVRRIRPVRDGALRFGVTGHHPDPQWLLDAEDVERGVIRTFAVKEIRRWSPNP